MIFILYCEPNYHKRWDCATLCYIPECREAIRVIKIALGDEQTAAVTRGKIAKGRAPGEEGGA